MKPILALVLVLFGVIATPAADAPRKFIVLKPSEARNAYPFSDAVLVGDTLYIAGTIGFDPQTGKPPASADQEARLAMDGVKEVLQSQKMTMEDLVSVQVFCTDLSLYDTFNRVYRSYFHDQFPARAFFGAASLIRGAHFELIGIALKAQK